MSVFILKLSAIVFKKKSNNQSTASILNLPPLSFQIQLKLLKILSFIYTSSVIFPPSWIPHRWRSVNFCPYTFKLPPKTSFSRCRPNEFSNRKKTNPKMKKTPFQILRTMNPTVAQLVDRTQITIEWKGKRRSLPKNGDLLTKNEKGN